LDKSVPERNKRVTLSSAGVVPKVASVSTKSPGTGSDNA
jgi:hypothetical protein